MNEVIVKRNMVNIEALDEALRVALDDRILGISTGPYGVSVHLTDNASEAQMIQAQAIVEAHDPAMMTARQQVEQERQQQLAALRGQNQTPLDLTLADGQDAVIQVLVNKLAWLEQEVLVQRGQG